MKTTLQLQRTSLSGIGWVEKWNPEEPDMLITLLSLGDMKLSSREGEQNRLQLYHKLGLDEERVYSLRQIHSRKVLLTGDIPRTGVEGDGLVADTSLDVLTVTVADCMPIFLFDPGKRIFALVHSGWKGTGIASDAVRLMKDRHGCHPSDLTAVMGPSIRSCCYRVDKERALFFKKAWGADAVRWKEHDGEGIIPHLDLEAANRAVLDTSGVSDIRQIDECTACTKDMGSFRSQGPVAFTHMLAMIGFFK